MYLLQPLRFMHEHRKLLSALIFLLRAARESQRSQATGYLFIQLLISLLSFKRFEETVLTAC